MKNGETRQELFVTEKCNMCSISRFKYYNHGENSKILLRYNDQSILPLYQLTECLKGLKRGLQIFLTEEQEGALPLYTITGKEQMKMKIEKTYNVGVDTRCQQYFHISIGKLIQP